MNERGLWIRGRVVLASGIAIAVLLAVQASVARLLAPGPGRSALLAGLMAVQVALVLIAEARPRRDWMWLVAALAVFAPYFLVIVSDTRWRFR